MKAEKTDPETFTRRPPAARRGEIPRPVPAGSQVVWLLLLLLVLTGPLAGCRSAGPGLLGLHSDHARLSQGYAAFEDGQFQQARAIFTRLCRSGGKEVAWRANYALELTAVMEAATIEGKMAAFRRWERISREPAVALPPEARILETVLVRLWFGRGGQGGPVGTWEDCRTALARKKREVENLQRRVKKMERRIGRLQKKIEAIEEIDQKIQQRKEQSLPAGGS